MFKSKTKEVEQPATPETDLMDAVVSTAEAEYCAILQRWIDKKSLTNDPERLRICCEQLQIPVTAAQKDKEILVKAKSLEPEIAMRDEANAKMNSYGEAYQKRKDKYDAYSQKELTELSELNHVHMTHSTIWHRAMDAERELRELKTKYPRAFGLKPEVQQENQQ